MKLTPPRAIAGFVAVVVVVLLAFFAARGTDSSTQSAPGVGAASSVSGVPGTKAPGVPEHAYVTLREIDAGRWPGSANAAGTQGGERWMNREGTLARTDAAGKAITYREWDVNPKQRNRSRDAERIVTGSDGSAWYTGDHYKTFKRMR
ncbi:ribonuclease domain-containing protein [Nocardia sp. XZ_19_385]|uniref:ribonuclease domain-containing protein n=1 Tax=Nocardia sp. XZ_19_385 TaxID=2769488 RepID=UPI00188FAABA|nr:ribonuclease domain-containing protein [Nocardia sp. XZ_19_385]